MAGISTLPGAAVAGRGRQAPGIGPPTIHLWVVADYHRIVVPSAAAAFIGQTAVQRADYPAGQEYRFKRATERVQRAAVLAAMVRWYCDSYRLPTDAVDWRIGTGSHGKPIVEGLPIGVNLSTSADAVVVAAAEWAAVGVDIELWRPGVDRRRRIDDVMGRFFDAAERDWVMAVNDADDRMRRFLSVWTQKEALVKAWGGSIGSDALAAVVVPPGNARAVDFGNRCWRVRDVSRDVAGGGVMPAGEFFAAVAWAAANAAAEPVILVHSQSSIATALRKHNLIA